MAMVCVDNVLIPLQLLAPPMFHKKLLCKFTTSRGHF